VLIQKTPQKLAASEVAKEKVGAVIHCSQCGRPRAIFSSKRLSLDENAVLTEAFEESFFSCGSHKVVPELPKLASIRDVMYANPALTCNDVIEKVYYSSELFDAVCAHCGYVVTEVEEKSRVEAEALQGGNPLPKSPVRVAIRKAFLQPERS
jgi:hypothetical protein